MWLNVTYSAYVPKYIHQAQVVQGFHQDSGLSGKIGALCFIRVCGQEEPEVQICRGEILESALEVWKFDSK